MMSKFRRGRVSSGGTLPTQGGREESKRSFTVDDVFTRWTASMLPLYKPSTRHFITATLAQLRRKFGKTPIANVTIEMLQAYVSSVPVTAKTTANRMTVFRTVWKSARAWGYVQHDPFVGLVLPKLVPPEPRCYTLDEVTRIINNAREPYKTLFLLAAETGMRAGEICALHWSEVNPDERTVTVARSVWKGQITTPKTRAGRRVICISEELVNALQRLRTARTGTVFETINGGPLDPEKVVQRQLRPLLKRLEIPGGGLHAFRHFNATMMDREAVPMKTRQTRLGHSSPQTTLQLYTHILTEEDRRTASSLSRHLGTVAKPVRTATHLFSWSSSTCGLLPCGFWTSTLPTPVMKSR